MDGFDRKEGRPTTPRFVRNVAATLATALALGAGACQDAAPLAVPPAQAVDSAYLIPAEHDVDVSGNVATLTVVQDEDQLVRGGSLWARVGPYVYLLGSSTQELFEQWPGLAAMRVVTVTDEGDEIARALLRRDRLNAVTWPEAINVAGHARVYGGQRPRLLEELVELGEELTEFEYQSRWTER